MLTGISSQASSGVRKGNPTPGISPQVETYARGFIYRSLPQQEELPIPVHKRPQGLQGGDISPDRKYRRKRLGLVHHQPLLGLTHQMLTEIRPPGVPEGLLLGSHLEEHPAPGTPLQVNQVS